MAHEFDREGEFRGEIIDYGLQKARESESLSVALKVRILEAYNFETEQWDDWRAYEPYEGFGNVWIIKKDGSPNQNAIESLVKFAGWSGDIAEIVHKQWKPTPIRFSVAADTYKNETRYKVGFLGDYNSVPVFGIKSIAPDEAKSFQAKYQSQLRAIASGAKRNSAAPSDRPPAPPARQTGVQEGDGSNVEPGMKF